MLGLQRTRLIYGSKLLAMIIVGLLIALGLFFIVVELKRLEK